MEEKNVVFTLDEVNAMLAFLGEVPAKHSLDLIKFIRDKALAQHPAPAEEPTPEETAM